jgi:photosystem II stability/assembly factor-like uncharacterized protein
MAKVFISYRRSDSATFAGRLYDRLVLRFGRDSIFKDVDDIPAGVRFSTYLQDTLRQCNVCLVLIGPSWLDARSESGQRRLDDPTDWVRTEIEQALALGLDLIPVLLDNTPLPAATQLPPSLGELVEWQSVQLRNDPDFNRDMERVFAAIERAFAALAAAQAAVPPSEPRAPVSPTAPVSLPSLPSGDAAEVSPTPVPAPPSTTLPAPIQQPPTGDILEPRGGDQVVAARQTTAPTSVPAPAPVIPSARVRPKPARGPLLGAIALLLVVAVAGGTLALHVLGSPTRQGQSPTATSVGRSPTSANLFGVALDSPTDGWAVGDSGALLHYTGGQWQAVSDPASLFFPDSVAMDSPTGGWAVGTYTILHYTGGRWQAVSDPTDANLDSVAMDSPTDGWAVGAFGLLLHYTGGRWQQVSSPTNANLFGVAMDSSTDGWAVGDSGALLHYTGGRWQQVSSPTSEPLFGVAMDSSTDGWAVGAGTILHYTGGRWQAVSDPDGAFLHAVAMDSSTDGWAVGDSGALLHYTGGQWHMLAPSTT